MYDEKVNIAPTPGVQAEPAASASPPEGESSTPPEPSVAPTAGGAGPAPAPASGSDQAPSEPPDPRQVIAALLAAQAAQREQFEQQMLQAEIEKRIAQLPEDQQQEARQRAAAALQVRAYLQQAQRQALQAQMALAQRTALFEAVARQAAIQDIAATYGVSPEEIRDYRTPDDMVRAAQSIANARRARALQDRAAGHVDTMPGQSSPALGFDRMSGLDILNWYYKEKDRLSGR